MTLERSATHSGEGSGNSDGGRHQSAYLYRVIQSDRPLSPSVRYSLAGASQVIIGRDETPEEGNGALRIKVSDPLVSKVHVELSNTLGRWILRDYQSRNGTFVNRHRVSSVILTDGDLVELGRTFFLYREAQPHSPEDLEQLDTTMLAPLVAGLRTLSVPLEHQFRALRRIIPSEISVVLEGESGTGKELIARAIHDFSRRAGSFVGVNCGALPPTLIQSELFGYRKGAFSGALTDRAGLVQSADRGTLFLDEIEDLPLGTQSTLLRVLQESQVLPVGGTRPIDVDLRVCSATHRSLDEMVSRRRFREDLLARISGFTLHLPPLRERREDLGLLIAELLSRHLPPARAERVSFTRKVTWALLCHSWPLNIRELEKCIGLSVVLAGEGAIRLEHLPEQVASGGRKSNPAAPPERLAPSPPSQERRALLIDLLKQHEGNLAAVGRALGKAPIQIRRWLQRYQLDPSRFRPGNGQTEW